MKERAAMTTPSKAESPSFRRIVRASRLIAEGKCPGCEMDYKPKIESLEAELRDTRRALEILIRGVMEEVSGDVVPDDLVQIATQTAIEAARKERGQ